MGTKSTEGAAALDARNAKSHSQQPLGQLGRQTSPEHMAFALWVAVDDIIPFIQLRKQLGDFFWRMLEIIIHCHNDPVASGADAPQKSIMLAVISHEPDAAQPGIVRAQRNDLLPTPIRASIVDEDDLILRADLRENGCQAL